MKILEESLAEANCGSLILEEEKKTLKFRIDSLNAEKSELASKLVQNTCITDTIESKIETEIEQLKDLLLNEIGEVKTQIEKSVNLQAAVQKPTPPELSRPNNRTHPLSMNSTTSNGVNIQKQSPRNSSSVSRSEAKTVFIASDSVQRKCQTRMYPQRYRLSLGLE